MRRMIFALCICGCGSMQTSFTGGHEGHAQVSSAEARGADVEGGRRLLNSEDAGKSVMAEGIGSYAEQRDEFNQSQKGVLDILLVIDNSASMANEQDQLASNLPDLLAHIRGSDWQIAVISTDERDCVSAPLTRDTIDYERSYRDAIRLGVEGSAQELYFHQAIKGLEGGMCRNTDTTWLREDSTVAVVIVGDERPICYQKSPCTRSGDLRAHLDSIRPKGEAKVYGLLPSPGKWRIGVSGDPTVLSIFAAYGSVSAKSYASTLQKISQNVHTALDDVFTLSQAPSGAVQVVVDGEELSMSQYTIDMEDRRLRFDRGYVPPDQATITVSYRYLID